MSLDHLRKRKTILSGIALSGLAVVSSNIPASAVPPGHLRAANTGAYADSVSGSYVLGAENLASGNPFNDYAIEGIVANDVGGVGMLGYGEPAKSYGVYGVTFGTNGIGVYGAGDGPTPAPGATPSSTQQSTGVVGNSASGDGVFGSTEFPNGSSDTIGGSPVGGVVGVDVTTNGNENNGVVGMTTNGGFGVAGFSSNADVGGSDVTAGGGVVGSATEGDGVDGFTNSGNGVSGSSGSNNGVAGSSESSNGVYGTSQSSNGVYGTSGSSYGVSGYSSSSSGAYVRSDSGNSAYTADIYNMAGGSGTGYGLEAEADNYAIVGRSALNPLALTDDSFNIVFRVDSSGDVYYNGTLNSVARTRNGYTASTYSARMATPTIEDVGTGNIVNGEGLVRLDPVLVEQMDRSTTYHVLITPDGDTRGLYVASKTPQGFVVRETQGGRGTLSFDYRIVANVDGQAGRRMSLSVARPAEDSTVPSGYRVTGRTNSGARPKSAKRAAFEAALRRSLRGSRAHIFVPQANVTVEKIRQTSAF